MPERIDIGGGVRLACTVSGNGPPLVLMHGAEGSHRMFDVLVPYLVDRFKVIAYDQRDCGDTENPPTPATLADLADDTGSLISALGHTQAYVYGTSFGGRVAQAFAHRHGQRIAGLVLGSTWPLQLALDELNPQGVAEIYSLRAALPDTAEALAAYFLPQPFLDSHPKLKDMFRTALPHSERSKRRFLTASDQPLLKPDDINVPTLVIAGGLDRVVPPAVTLKMADDIAGAAKVLLDDVGHAGALQVPAVIAEHIKRFCLNSRELGAGVAV